MHTADGQDYYDYISDSCRPKDPLKSRIDFLEKELEELREENADLRRRCGIKKRIYNPHLCTMCEE